MKRHRMRSCLLLAGIACSSLAWAQAGGSGGGGGRFGGSAGSGEAGGAGATTRGAPAAPSRGTDNLPGGAPGVQREPLNRAPGANGDDGRGSPGATGIDGIGDGGSTGGAAPMSDDDIHQACMMKADPADCRTRLRSGETDDSVERDPP